MLRFSFFFLLSVLGAFSGQAQTVIRGSILFEDSRIPVVAGSVLAMDREGNGILTYSISDELGKFTLEFESETDSVLIKVNSMEIAEIRRILRNESQELVFLASPAVRDLGEVVVESLRNPIMQKRDTLEYSVEGFKRPSDLVLSDLLKRLPGVEVSSTGMIRYEGKPLQHFYVEGMDLLQGRYNLINKNLSVDAVESIQILENHQPIRILDSLVSSDRASLNLSLKKKNTWAGTGRVGGGAAPFLWDLGFTPMLFRTDHQFLGSLQANNVGNDLAIDLDPLTIEDLMAFEPQKDFQPWSSISSIVPSIISQKRYAFNRSILGSVNSLRKLREGGELRTNISYLDNRIEEEGFVQSSYFLPSDTVNIREVKSLVNRDNKLDAEVGWIKNSKDVYLKNTTALKLSRAGQNSKSLFDSSLLDQKITIPYLEFRNSAQAILPLGKQLLQAKSELAFRSSEEVFVIAPGRFENLLNEGEAYDQLDQEIGNRSFFTVNSLGFTKKVSSKWVFTPTLGFKYQYERMESRLEMIDSSESKVVGLPFQNAIADRELKVFLRSQMEYTGKKLVVAIDVPVSYMSVFVEDPAMAFERSFGKGLVEGNLRATYEFNQKFKSTLLFSRKNEVTGIHELHGGYLLRNFLTFQQKASQVPVTLRHAINYLFAFKDPLTSTFLSGKIGVGRADHNTILGSEILSTGEGVYTAHDLENRAEEINANLRAGKYFSLISTNVALGGSFQHNARTQIVNQVLSDLTLSVRGFSIDIDSKPASFLGLSLKSSYSLTTTEMEYQTLDDIAQFTFESSIESYLSENHSIRLNWEYYKNELVQMADSKGNSFLDLSFLMKVSKHKLDIKATASNLLNCNEFQTYYSNLFSLVSQQYRLRPRQFVLSANFSF